MTAWVTGPPRWASAVSFIFCKMKAEICDGEYCLPSTLTHASPLGPRTILYGTRAMSFLLIGSSNCRPISRLIAKIVRSGLVTACRLAGWPTRRSPSSVNATMDGVVRAPSEFSMTLGVEPSMTATHELVVPRSMPITFAISFPCSFAGPPAPKRPSSQEAFRRALQAVGSLFRSPFLNARFPLARFPLVRREFAPEPASPGVYRWGDLAAQGAEAADFSSFALVLANRQAPSPFS